MPKFVSELSGHVYALSKSSGKRSDDDDNLDPEDANNKDSVRKPSAINKKGTKERQKNSLDSFKEELRRLQKEKDDQRNKLKRSIKGNHSDEGDSSRSTAKSHPVPVPLKPDPRCPTTLTLQVNLNPNREASASGSFDNGDPTTTNLYLGNLNPEVNENDLCDVFGKFGSLASIKIMWPRTDEERARNRNSGFVAYMSRIDAERALNSLNGREFRGYNMKLGWGKAVPIPQNPVYVPPELLKLTEPPPQSGLPFNGQLHESDIQRGYVVPNPYPRPLPAELEAEVSSNPDLKSIQEAYCDFIGVVGRSTVKVVTPSDRSMLDKIHKTIEYVIREGPVFEAIIIARESKNPAYKFLYDNQSPEHIYYRWKLYSILHGDDPYEWRTEEFRMFEGGPIWRPPPLNPYAEGMPEELLGESLIAVDKATSKRQPFLETSSRAMHNDSRIKGTLGEKKREMLGDLLRNLDPTKDKVGASMLFCINHSDAAKEIIECICESLKLLETPFQKKIARLFLVSDILHNCSAAVTNASYYREGFQGQMVSIFEHLREYLINIEDRYKADKFKQKTLCVLGAWKEWTLYENEFVLKLSNILLGIKQNESHEISTEAQETCPEKSIIKTQEDELDGLQVDDETLEKCLEAKGLSLRWYKTLELSEDEEEESDGGSGDRLRSGSEQSRSPSCAKESDSDRLVRFKTSKWETVDPNEVAGQVVTISKWESLARDEDEVEGGQEKAPDFSSRNGSAYCNEEDSTSSLRKKFKTDVCGSVSTADS